MADSSVELELRRCRDLVAPAVDHYLPRGDPENYLYAPLRRGLAEGKGLRPALCLASCRAFGGREDDAIWAAVSIEMLHGALLVHDDVEDGSDWRRGRPTVRRSIGAALAVNVGDALAIAALRPLHDQMDRIGPSAGRRLLNDFERMAWHTLEGQAVEIGWRRDNIVDLSPDDYLSMVLKKTCWYSSIFPLLSGALIATGRHEEREPLVRFGYFLGAAFQIADDVLNLTADANRYGKEILGDLVEGKRSLVLIHLLSTLDAATRKWLVDYLARPEPRRSAAEARSIATLMEEHGSIEFAHEFALGLLDAASGCVDEALAGARDPHAVAFLHDLIGFVLHRDR